MAASSGGQLAPVLVGLGSNRCHGRYGPPRAVVAAALAALARAGAPVVAVSRIIETKPLGPSKRRYANCVAELGWQESPEALLRLLNQVERAFGRRRWRRWGARVLDLDLLAFGQMTVEMPHLRVPHRDLHRRSFVLAPMLEVAPDWRHPDLGLTSRQMWARLGKAKPVGDWGMIETVAFDEARPQP